MDPDILGGGLKASFDCIPLSKPPKYAAQETCTDLGSCFQFLYILLISSMSYERQVDLLLGIVGISSRCEIVIRTRRDRRFRSICPLCDTSGREGGECAWSSREGREG